MLLFRQMFDPQSSTGVMDAAAVCRAARRAAQAISTLQQNGFTDIVNLTGGMLRCRAEAHPVEGGRN